MKEEYKAKYILSEEEINIFKALKHIQAIAEPNGITEVEDAYHLAMKDLKWSVGDRIFNDFIQESYGDIDVHPG